MAHRGPAAVQVVLSEGERGELEKRAAGSDRRAATRARVVLACAQGMSNPQVADAVGVSLRTVGRLRAQFAARGLADLEDAGPVGRSKAAVVLIADEHAQLQRWARRTKTAQYLALRSKIVLRAAEGGTDKQIAADLDVDPSTVQRWRTRFQERRLDGLQRRAPTGPAPIDHP